MRKLQFSNIIWKHFNDQSLRHTSAFELWRGFLTFTQEAILPA